MKELTFKIGTVEESISAEEKNIIAVLNSSFQKENPDEEKIINDALDHPIGTESFASLFPPHESIAIIISDITRPLPSSRILPILLKRLYALGIQDEDITIVVALGSHRKETEEELKTLVGQEIYDHIKVVNTGTMGFTHLGETKQGTPVDIDTLVVNAKHRICIGNVEYHYFAGFSGGAKAIMPGCSTPKAIEKNHRFMVSKDARAGRLEGNPVRDDLEEAAGMLKPDLILNVVLNTHKQVTYAAAGDMIKAHRDACNVLAENYLSPIPETADIVIVSQGGAPKDLNLYQTQKALANAEHAVKDGGIIILMGACEEGFGNLVFEKWMKTYKDPDQSIQALFDHFQLGAHKAAAIAMVRKKAEIFFVSNMDEAEVRKTFLIPFSSLPDAFKAAMIEKGKNATIIAMPYGGSTLPVVI